MTTLVSVKFRSLPPKAGARSSSCTTLLCYPNMRLVTPPTALLLTACSPEAIVPGWILSRKMKAVKPRWWYARIEYATNVHLNANAIKLLDADQATAVDFLG